ncbi:hypothetical protein SOVF_093250 [Spinacia oleracea]|uniref:F-box protein At1g10110 n=1 Tax=Spinacia oleracea TaxID=3562 RepID=A0A9R0IEZ2_SPIOL|nr:F-box protein At1g10110-like [Spinacia oleracea]KNA15995.1 hypothetical protein SOVF_093250 [Spinacia oleracea]
MADWSKLTTDVLCEIALKLDAVEDLVDFSAVCSSWYCVYTMIKKKWTAKMPWLMLAENTEEEDNPNYIRKTFCHMRERCYSLSLPQSFGARCWGSSSGWIVTFDFKLELHMLNPFSGVRIRLPDPPPQRDPFIHSNDEDRKIILEIKRLEQVEKVVVLGGDEYDDDCVVVVIYDFKMCRVAYTRPKYDQSWTFVRTPKTCRAYDVVRRGSQILIVYGNGGLGCFDISADEGGQPVRAREYVPAPPPEFLGSLPGLLHGIYLVIFLCFFGTRN